MALSIRKITAVACERIARRAFEHARKRRKLVTAVHKANNFILTDGLFLREVRRVAAEFPDVKLEEVIVDAMAARLVRDPAHFDVVVATNFYADILSDLASELSGSLGLAGAINAGDTMCAAQAQHGSAPDIAGQDRANPTSLILSTAMLLDWMSRKREQPVLSRAAKLFDRVTVAIAENAGKTPLFSAADRLAMVRPNVAQFPNVAVTSFNGLLVDFAVAQDATAIIRGLRALSDFEFEFNMALMNRHLEPRIETIFVMPNEQFSYTSSSLVKQVAQFGGDITHFVPHNVGDALTFAFKRP